MAYGGIDVHKNQCQMCIFTEAGEVLHQRIRIIHFAPMWLNAHGQPCSTPDRHVDFPNRRFKPPP
jgi:hypothetical protein